jgi:hypothetical protein
MSGQRENVSKGTTKKIHELPRTFVVICVGMLNHRHFLRKGEANQKDIR